MTPDLLALETRLLLPLQRAAADATARLGMTLDPDRELPQAEASGDDVADAAVLATAAADAAPLVQVAGTATVVRPRAPAQAPGGTGHEEPYAISGGLSAPQAAQSLRPQAPAPAFRDEVWPADRAPATTPLVQASSEGLEPGSDLSIGVGLPASTYGVHRGAIEASAVRPESSGAQPNLVVAPVSPAVDSPDAHRGPRGEPPGPAAIGLPDSLRLAAGLPLSPAQAQFGSSGEAPAAPDAVVLQFSIPRGNAASPPGTAGRVERPIVEAPPQPSSDLSTDPGYPAIRGLPRGGTFAPASGAANSSSMPFPVAAANDPAADGSVDQSATPTGRGPTIGSGAPANATLPDEPFGGLIPVRPLADTPSLGDRVALLLEDPSRPLTRSLSFTQPALGEVARAIEPILSRAADLGEAAWDDEGPRAAAPSISNTFNITVAMAGSTGPVEREALQDALTDLLRDAARRQGLDL